MIEYADRAKAWRETKLRHTLEKRNQQGYMDADDYGTVPLPPDYSFKPEANSTNGGFYGYSGMAKNFCHMLDCHPVYVDPIELLCGRWRDMMSNYRVDKRWDEMKYPYEDLKPLQELYNITSGIDNDAHCACDYSIGLQLGFGGLEKKLHQCRSQNPGHDDFYDAEEQVLRAIIRYVRRHSLEVERLLEEETRPEIRISLQEMLAANKDIETEAPKTFHQVCQWVAHFNCVSRIYTRDGAGFQLDVVLLPYYQRDVAAGILDSEKAKFLLANLLLIDPHYYQLSGADDEGQDLTNELSWLVLEAAHELNIAANLTVRVHESCNKEFLKIAVNYLFTDRNGWPRFCGDKSLIEGYMRTGADRATANKRVAVGCNWMCVPGCEFPMNDTVKINIAKVFEVALQEMEQEELPSTERLFSIFGGHLKRAVKTTAAGVNLHLDHQWDVTPELVMNLMMHGPLETGKDISQCAQIYTIGVDGAGLAVVADSFAALKQRVEQEKQLTWSELYLMLHNNFSGADGERARLMLSASQRYCGGNTLGDQWAQRLTELFTDIVRNQDMPSGRQLIPGWFSWSRTILYGSMVGATPNGRKKGEPISHGANPNPGFRVDGAVTAMSTGIAAVQPGYGNTAPLQLEFDPRMSAEEGGVERVLELILGHFRLGGTLININVLDGEKLLAAHKNPNAYPDLVVRVTGFTAYFAVLSPAFRQLVVNRFLSGL